MEDTKSSHTVDNESVATYNSSSSKKSIHNFESSRIVVKMSEILIPRYTVRSVSNAHVQSLRQMLFKNGYRPLVGAISVCITSVRHDDPPRKIVSGDLVEAIHYEITLADGHHRLLAIRSLASEDEVWQEFYESPQEVILYTQKGVDNQKVDLCECIHIGGLLNDISSSVLKTSVKDTIHTAVSVARTLYDVSENPNWSMVQPTRIARYMSSTKLGCRQVLRYGKVATRIAPYTEVVEAFFNSFDSSEGRLGLVHLHSSLLAQTNDEMIFSLGCLSGYLSFLKQGRFENHATNFYSLCRDVYKLVCNVATSGEMDMKDVLGKNLTVGRESFSVKSYCQKKVSKVNFEIFTSGMRGRLTTEIKKRLVQVVPPVVVLDEEHDPSPEQLPKNPTETPLKTAGVTPEADIVSAAAAGTAMDDDLGRTIHEDNNVDVDLASPPHRDLSNDAAQDDEMALEIIPHSSGLNSGRLKRSKRTISAKILDAGAGFDEPPLKKRGSKRHSLSVRQDPPKTLKKQSKISSRKERGPRSMTVQIPKTNSPTDVDESIQESEVERLEPETDLFDDEVPMNIPFGLQEPQPEQHTIDPQQSLFMLRIPPSKLNTALIHNARHFLTACYIPSNHRAHLRFKPSIVYDQHHMVHWHAMFNSLKMDCLPHEQYRKVSFLSNARWADREWSTAMSEEWRSREYFAVRRTELLHAGFCIMEGMLEDNRVPAQVELWNEMKDIRGGKLIGNASSSLESSTRVCLSTKDYKLQDQIVELFRFWQSEFEKWSHNSSKRSSGVEEDFYFIVNRSNRVDDLEASKGIGRFSTSRHGVMELLEKQSTVQHCCTRAQLDTRLALIVRLLNICGAQQQCSIPSTGGRALCTVGGTQRQILHVDGWTTVRDDGSPSDSPPGVFAIATGADETPLWVLRGSHIVLGKHFCRGLNLPANVDKTMFVEKVMIPPWSVLICIMDVVHAGAGSADYNEGLKRPSWRYHMYFKPTDFQLGDGVGTISGFHPTFLDGHDEDNHSSNTNSGP